MKTKQFIAYLEAHGCKLLRQGSRHAIYVSPSNGKKFAIPRHGSQEVSVGVVNRAKKELGIE